MRRLLETVCHDFRYGIRMLLKKRAFTAVVIITLALGIGANTAIFSIVDTVLFRPLPFREPNRLVNIWESETKQLAMSKMFSSYRDFHQWELNNHSFEKMAAYTWATGGLVLTGIGDAQSVLAIPASQDFFNVFGTQPLLGRTFQPDDFVSGSAVVISHKMWQTTFGGAPDIIGRNITLSDKSYIVVGVMPATFKVYPEPTSLWYPMTTQHSLVKQPNQHLIVIVARIKPGISFSAAEKELVSLRQAAEQQESDNFSEVGVVLNDLQNEYTWMAGRNLRSGLLTVLASVALVLLIACVNVANLQLGRASERKKEMAIRTALGSGRRRLIRQLLTESLLLSTLGAVLGIVLAKLLIGWFVATRPIELPPGSEVRFDIRVLAFTIIVTILVGMLSGIIPAMQASRIDLNETLKESSRGNSRSALSSLSGRIMILTEISLALVLLIGASLLIQSVVKLRNISTGYRTDNILTTRISLSDRSYQKSDQRIAFYETLTEKLRTLPGVQSVTMGSTVPPHNAGGQSPLFVEGRPAPPPKEQIFDIGQQEVFPDFFQTMDVPLLKGRYFDRMDRDGSERVVVINQELANRYFPYEDPIGHHIKAGSDTDDVNWSTIVGVVGNMEYMTVFKEMGFDKPPIVFYPFAQSAAGTMNVFVSGTAPTDRLVPAIRREIRALDSGLLINDFQTMNEIMSDTRAQPRFRAILVGAFAALAMLLAAVGIYGVLSQSVIQRTNEIGIRMALGAEYRDIVKLILSQSMKIILAGIALGIVGALLLGRVVASLLYGVQPTDVVTFAGVSVLLILVAVLACYIPARRAIKVDPMIALRQE